MSSNVLILRDSTQLEPELDHKTRKVSDKFSENINIIANQPSLAFFRIQEHVRKTLPQLVEQKHEVQNIQQKVQGACFDTEYATNAVKTMYQSESHFQNIQELLKNAMFMKQQIGYEENRRKQENSNPSMYSPGSTGQGTAGSGPMSESTQSSDSSLAHSGHAQTSEPDASGSLSRAQSTPDGALAREYRARAATFPAYAPPPPPRTPANPSVGQVSEESRSEQASTSPVVLSDRRTGQESSIVSVNTHSEDLDEATEANEDSHLS